MVLILIDGERINREVTRYIAPFGAGVCEDSSDDARVLVLYVVQRRIPVQQMVRYLSLAQSIPYTYCARQREERSGIPVTAARVSVG